MKANELRIGNYVFDRENRDDNTFYKIALIKSPEYNTWSSEDDYLISAIADSTMYDIIPSGIPLTEELLSKCNAKENSERYFIGLFCLHYDWDENGNKWFYFCPETLPNIKIKYLHQLQNLYFALTGEELIINL